MRGTGTFMRTLNMFGQGLADRRQPQQEQRPAGTPGPSGDPSRFSGFLQNFSNAIRQTNRDLPEHGAPQFREGMEQLATATLFPDSGTAGMRPYPTPEEQAATRAAIGQFGREVLFGPERGSVLPFVDEASDPERLIRDWGLSEQEFRLSGQAFSEGRLGAGSAWGALGIMAAIPVVGWTGRGLVKLGRTTARAATSGADTAPLLRAARRDVVPDELRALDELDARWKDGQFEVGFDDPRRLELIQDLDRSGVVEFAEMWGSDFDFIRNFQQLTGDVIAGGNPNIPFDLWIGLRAIEHSPPTSAPIYRGLSMTPDELAQITVGSGYALPPSSFTYVRGEALDFMSIRTSGQPVMIVVEEGASALPIGAIWQGAGIGEVVSNGLFEVISINRVTTGAGARGREIAVKHGDYTEITLRQVEPIRVSPEPRHRGGRFEDVSIVNADEIAGRVGGEAAQAARALPEAPLTASIPAGHVRLVHQTDASADALRSSGIRLDEARGIEGPRGVYAVEPEAGRGFYGEIENFGGVTVEFSVPAEEWARSGGVLNRTIRPDEIVAVHEPWHFHARRMSEGDVLSEIRSGELTREYFASLGDDWVRAYDHVVSDIAAGGRVGGESAQAARLADDVLAAPDDFVYHVSDMNAAATRDLEGSWGQFSGGVTNDLDNVRGMLNNPAYLDLADPSTAVVTVWRRADLPDDIASQLAQGDIHNLRTFSDPAVARQVDDLMATGMTRQDAINELGLEMAETFAEGGRFTRPTFVDSAMPEPAGVLSGQDLLRGPGRAAAERSGRAVGGAGRSAQEIFSSPQAFEETGRTLYHGTPATFERFESAAATWRGRGQRPTSSEGYFYFSDDPNVAASFRQNVSDVSVERWLDRYPDMLFDFEDLRQPEVFQMFVDDVTRSLRNQDLQIARDDYAQAWESIRPQDLTVADVLDFEYPIRAVSPRGQVVETRVFGREIDLSGMIVPNELPAGLRQALEADGLLRQTGVTSRLASWQGHEKGIPNTVEWMRENGYGRMVVPDAFESGGRSVIALEEYIEFGRSVDEVFQAARSASGVG